MPFISSVSASSRGGRQRTIPIVFPFGWDGLKGPAFDWYRSLPCQYFNRLQVLKDCTGPVPHRFIVAHLTDGSRQRFDRRPKSKNSGKILAAGFFNTSVIEAADETEDALLDTIGEVGGPDIDVHQVARDVVQSRLEAGYSPNEAQFTAMWNASLYATLRAIHQHAHGRAVDDTTTREHIFDEALYTARDSALLAAQATIRDTAPQLNNCQRDAMWEKIWEAWNPAWEAGQRTMRKSVFSSVEVVERLLVSNLVQAVALEIGSSHLRLAPVKVNIDTGMTQDQTAPIQASNVRMTHIELQEFLQKLIRASTMEQDSAAIIMAMDRVWKFSRQVLINT
ncbi:hypothetical protein FRC07_006789 [Ceratobasidium sp. 392]|nr:hypothetical protein FRC07_006789 [Ceratobasidium sp. 392]